MVSSTGSTAARAAVAKSESARITPVNVLEDADFDLAVRDALGGAFSNKAEACTAASRLINYRCLYPKSIDKIPNAKTGSPRLRPSSQRSRKTCASPLGRCSAPSSPPCPSILLGRDLHRERDEAWPHTCHLHLRPDPGESCCQSHRHRYDLGEKLQSSDVGDTVRRCEAQCIWQGALLHRDIARVESVEDYA